MLHAGKVPVLKGIALLLQHFERLRLQIRRVHRIELRREYLYRHLRRDGIDIGLGQQRRMSDGEAVQQRLRAGGRIEILRSKIEASPAAVAISYSANLWVLSSQMASACQNLGRSSFAGVRGEILVEVELRPRRLARGEDVYWQRVVVEAVQSAMSISEGSVRWRSLQVWHVDCGSNCLCQMVGKQSVVAKLPAEEIADEQDSCGRGRACHVSLV
jgi:hypothetical protein